MWFIQILRHNSILLLLHLYTVHANTFANTLCTSSALKVVGQFEDSSSCARECASTEGCRSFFYDSEGLECYIVEVVLTSTSGCEAKSGVKYFVNAPDVDDCYTFTAEDVSLVGSGNSWEYQCESHPFNVYTGGNNVDYPGCGNCTCCKLKGCLHGHARSYNGRWSKTNTGRQCQRWDAQFPHEHQMNFSSYFPKDKSIHDAHNYCRDPDYSYFPWCYTVDPDVRWESCGILSCKMTHYKFVEA